MKKWLLLVGLASCMNANATVLTFDAETPSSFSTLSTQGYDLQASVDGITYVSSGGSSFCGPPCVYNGTNHILAWLGASFSLSASDGSTFDFTGFDGGEAHTEREASWAQSILVTGTTAGGAIISESFILDFINDGEGPLNDFQSFSPLQSFTNLVSLNFEGIGGNEWFTVDNINVDTSEASSVPEPASLALLGLGLTGLGFARKKAKS